MVKGPGAGVGVGLGSKAVGQAGARPVLVLQSWSTCRWRWLGASLLAPHCTAPHRRKAQERGDYGEAILLCVQCFQGVDTLRQLGVSQHSRKKRAGLRRGEV